MEAPGAVSSWCRPRPAISLVARRRLTNLQLSGIDLKKVVDGDCKPKILMDVEIANAARMLRELDGAGD